MTTFSVESKAQIMKRSVVEIEPCAATHSKPYPFPMAIGYLKTKQERDVGEAAMDGIQQVALPILGILAASALTFYAVSFGEIREKSFRELEESESENEGFKTTLSSRERRAIRKAEKQNKS